MSKSIVYRLFSILILAGMIFGSVQPGGVQAYKTGASASPKEPTGKIEALVLKEIEAEGTIDFFVWMTEKADLNPADHLKTKLEKGQFVFNALYMTAERTQKDLRVFLDEAGVDYQTFYIANKILVRGGGHSLLAALAARTDVAEITANHKYQIDEPLEQKPAADSTTAVEPNLTFINADDVWAMGYNGAGTVMAGNDTGLDETHPAIAPHYRGCLNPPACSSWDHNYNWWDATGTYPTNPSDGFGHGTHTTGIMVGDDFGGNQIGVAPGAQTIHCKNMTDGGGGDDATFTECFQWDLAPWDLNRQNPRVDMAPDAVNNSWGYWGGNLPLFKDEIQALHAAGILVEVSAGGEGSYCASLRSPADYWEVLTTGAVDHADPFPGTLIGFSARGPSELDGDYFPDILAPGMDIRSALPGTGYAYWSGTSFAGPHATALIGLLWQACPSLRGMVYPTIDYIHQAAAPLTGQFGSNCGGDYTNGPNNDWGEGTIDALATVQLVLNACTMPVEAAWEKEVWINGEGPFDPAGTIFGVLTADEVVIVDQVSVAYTTTVNFWLEETWQDALALTSWEASAGTVMTGTNVLTWEIVAGMPETWYTITKTFEVQEGDWMTSSLTETLWVDGMVTQPAPIDVTFEHLLPDIVAPVAVEANLYQGETITQELDIVNDGGDDLVWQITVIPTATWLVVDPTNGSTLPAETTQVSLAFDAVSIEAGIYTTTLEITSNDPDEPLTVVPVTLTVEASADLALEQTDDLDPVWPGELVVYTLHVKNIGPGGAANVILVDTLPISATFIFASGDCGEAGGLVTCNLGTIVNGQEIVIYITVQAPDMAGEMFNEVVVTSDTYDPLGVNNSDTEHTVIEDVLVVALPLLVKH